MDEAKRKLPGFKPICTSIAVLYVLLGVSTLLQGPHAVLTPFGVPAEVIASPHFADFFHWLFVHMTVLGLLIGLLGRLVEAAPKQRLVARVLLLVALHYLYLDVRTSVWGSGLYAHPKSLAPVFIDALVVACFIPEPEASALVLRKVSGQLGRERVQHIDASWQTHG